MTLDESRVDLVSAGSASVETTQVAGWREIDRALRKIARSERRLEVEKGRLLLAAREAAIHLRFGYATFAEYVERVFGYGPRDTRDRLRVAEALVALPGTTAALAAGQLPYTAVRVLTNVLTPANEEVWLERVTGRTVREVESMVSGHKKGDLPGDPIDPDLRSFALRFDLSPEQLALFRDARRDVVQAAGHALSDEEALAALCRAALSHGPETRKSSKPPYQVFVTVCERCERGWQEGAGELLEVGAAVVAQAGCDAELVRRTSDGRSRKSTTIPTSVRNLVMRRDHHRCIVPGCRNSEHLEVHHLVHRARGGDNHPDNLAALCSGHHAAHHAGKLVIIGKPGAFEFRHEDGRAWGAPPPDPAPPMPPAPAPSILDELRLGLRGLGIKGPDITAAIERAATHVSHDTPLEVWFREALRGYHGGR